MKLAEISKIRKLARDSEESGRTAMEHANQVGLAMEEARQLLGPAKWRRWMLCSCPNIRRQEWADYLYVAKHWNDEIIVIARNLGKGPTDFINFRRLIRSQSRRS